LNKHLSTETGSLAVDDLADPLTALRDIHLPSGLPWWPPAPAWWLLLLLLLLAALTLLLPKLRRRYRRLRLRRATLRTIAGLRERHRRGEAQQALAAELSLLLRRTAMTQFPHEPVAGLIGRPWLEFLERSGARDEFTRDPGRELTLAPYRHDNDIDMEGLLTLSERWVKNTI
jgi:hypothetical protein